MNKNIINCNVDPFVPEGWTVEEHQKDGQFQWDPANVELYSFSTQKGTIDGNKFRKELVGKSVLNANVLDYLLANPDLIPEEWKDEPVFFWGTIYRTVVCSNSLSFVRFLLWRKDVREWCWGRKCLDNRRDRFSAALRKN